MILPLRESAGFSTRNHESAATSSVTATGSVIVSTMTPTAQAVTAAEGVAATNVSVATFTDTLPSSGYTATINWGDGSSPSSGTVTGSAGSYTVTGSHTYVQGGAFAVTATVNNATGQTTIVNSTATVSDPAITVTGANFTAQAWVTIISYTKQKNRVILSMLNTKRSVFAVVTLKIRGCISSQSTLLPQDIAVVHRLDRSTILHPN